MRHDDANETINDWYRRYSDDIYQYIFFMINDYYSAKDLTQDTFLRAYQKFTKFDGENERGWLFRIARNLAIDHIRSRKKFSLLNISLASFKNMTKSTEQIIYLDETERELYEALCRLKQSHRDVIILRKIKEFSIEETAEILGWSKSKVKSSLLRGSKQLKKEMMKEGYIHESI